MITIIKIDFGKMKM